MSCDTRTPHVGDIWLEMDPRGQRFVRVLSIDTVHMHRAEVVRVFRSTHGWVTPTRYRPTRAKLSRFNGKRGGYQFVEAAS